MSVRNSFGWGTASLLLSVMALGGVAGCAEGFAEQSSVSTSARVGGKDQDSLAGLAERVRNIEEGLPLLACGPGLRALLREVREKCKSQEAEAQSQATTASSDGMCNEKEMKVAIAVAERDLDTKRIGLRLLELLRHEVIYPGPDGRISMQRELRLKVLAEERRMPSTRFLLVAGGADATRRMEAVSEVLHKHGMPYKETVLESDGEKSIDRFERPWHYSLGIPLSKLKPVDQPVPPAEAPDLERAVFLFRTECQ